MRANEQADTKGRQETRNHKTPFLRSARSREATVEAVAAKDVRLPHPVSLSSFVASLQAFVLTQHPGFAVLDLKQERPNPDFPT